MNEVYALDGIPSERNKFILATSRDGSIYNKES